MKKINFGTTQNLIYIDYSTSGASTSFQSSANPVEFSNNVLFPNLIFVHPKLDLIEASNFELNSSIEHTVSNNVIESLEKSIRDNSSVWDRLSKL